MNTGVFAALAAEAKKRAGRKREDRHVNHKTTRPPIAA